MTGGKDDVPARRPSTRELVSGAFARGTVLPGFNIPYLPMMEPVVAALRDARSVGLIMVARLEWIKLGAGSLEAVAAEYRRTGDRRHTRLHLDHVPVVDEDGLAVDFEAAIGRALDAGYESVMVDGSRLPLEENIACTRRVAAMAHAREVPVEAELGAVLGHEDGPLPPYEELFASGRGFTAPAEARRFVGETGADWLSVAVGNVHGAISAAKRDGEKIEARLDLGHLEKIRRAAGVPLVLHGGTGIRREHVREAVRRGIAKINIATAIRQPYERAAKQSVAAGQRAVYGEVSRIIREDLRLQGSADRTGQEEES